MTEDYGALAKEAREEAEAVAFDYDNSSALLFELADAIDALQAQLDNMTTEWWMYDDLKDTMIGPYAREPKPVIYQKRSRLVGPWVEVTD